MMNKVLGIKIFPLVGCVALFILGMLIGKSCGDSEISKLKANNISLKENLSQTESISMEKTKDLNDCISQISTIKEVSEDKLDSLRQTLPKVRRYYISNDIKFRPVEDQTELQGLSDSILSLRSIQPTRRVNDND